MSATRPDIEDDLRKHAVQRLRDKAGFRTHLVMYLGINAFLVLIWAVIGTGFFWPIFPLVGWGIGVAANAWDVYGPNQITEERIVREMERLRR